MRTIRYAVTAIGPFIWIIFHLLNVWSGNVLWDYDLHLLSIVILLLAIFMIELIDKSYQEPELIFIPMPSPPLPRPVRLSSGYIYLLQTDSGYWKIGRAKDPADRLRTFNVKLPFTVEFAHLIPCEDMYRAERALHARYAALRVNGSEFFALTESDVEAIKQIKEL